MKLYKRIAEELKKDGINLNVTDIYQYQEEWLQWYKGYVPSFHKYKMKVNGINKSFERKTLNLAKKFCEDMAKLLWTEKTKISLDSEEKTQALWDILDSKENSFTINFASFLEKTCAIGTGVTTQYQDEKGNILIDYIDGNMVIPFKFTNSYISGLVTVNRIHEEKKYYTQITIHEIDDAKYTRINKLYESENENDIGKEISLETKFPNVKEKEVIETTKARFQVLKLNMVNNIDLDTPMGISLYANALDTFKSADTKFDGFFNEYVLGRKRILVDKTAMKATTNVNEKGEVEHVQYFDENDIAYVAIAGMEEQPVKEIDFTLRTEAFIKGINTDIDYASSNMGLGANWLKFEGSGVKTATEVISENSEAFRTKKHHEITVTNMLYDLVASICEMAGIETSEIKIETDDSIIEDKETERVKAQSETLQGLRSKMSYLTEIRGLTEEEALKEMAQMEAEKKASMALEMDNMEE